MWPIDEHAKSGAWVLLFLPKSEEGPPFVTAFWSGGERGGWFGPFVGEGNYGSYWCGDDPVGYLPASWVENAAKMRKALRDIDRYNDSPVGFDSHINSVVEPALAATEWPKKQGEKK